MITRSGLHGWNGYVAEFEALREGKPLREKQSSLAGSGPHEFLPLNRSSTRGRTTICRSAWRCRHGQRRR